MKYGFNADFILKKSQKSKGKNTLIRGTIKVLLLLVVLHLLMLAGLYYYFRSGLPDIHSLVDYNPPLLSTVFSDDGRKIAEFYKEKRIVVSLDIIPDMLKKAFIAAEDARFHEHPGVDLVSIIRAMIKNIKGGSIIQGGSTITQQVAKSFFLTPEKTYRRKIKEAILAYRIDKSFSKEEILYLYLNQIYLGHGAYGVQAAAENYFGNSVKDLTLAECAMLAGLPQAPSRYSPYSYPEKAKERQIYVLNRMVEEGHINSHQAATAKKQEIEIVPKQNLFLKTVPYFTEHIRRFVVEKHGMDAFLKEGFTIYTTVDIEMQQAALQVINEGLKALDKRQGYRGPIRHLEPEKIEAFVKMLNNEVYKSGVQEDMIVEGVVVGVDDRLNRTVVRLSDSIGILKKDDMQWAFQSNPRSTERSTAPGDILKPGDVILVKTREWIDDNYGWRLALEQEPTAQAALICIETGTGEVKAMVGGRDFKESQFNRAVQSRRQPGSAFKPIIYAAALDKGYTPATIVYDTPVVLDRGDDQLEWKPENYEKEFHGPVFFRTALAKSLNLATIGILKDIGIDYTIRYAEQLGITSNLNPYLSLALGSSGVSLLELTTAYSVFANYGYRIKPTFIRKITGRHGNEIMSDAKERIKVIEETTAYLMTSLLQSVVESGTGWRVKALGRPAAGKTGTTDHLHDAWFIGYTPQYITGVWVGFDDEKPLGFNETGSRAASPIWLGFMKEILKDKPVGTFRIPNGVVFTKIDPDTGLLPAQEEKSVVFEVFKEGTSPTENAGRPGEVKDMEKFYKSIM
ncbi:MAG TPA: PBP1A family penicillin-binding protein [Deltaproteobacteria bacterium]|nr:PBP1A family penicillin-binding protein [Deltaproteobacteria bacterium]